MLPSSSAITRIFLYAASFFCKSYSIPTSLKIQASRIIKNVPPTDHIKAPVTSPYCQSPNHRMGRPIDIVINIGKNSKSTKIASKKLVPKVSIIRLNLIVSSCTRCEAPSICRALSNTLW